MIVLDTHVWLWWVSQPSLLSRPAAGLIDEASEIGVSVLSCWEVAMLAKRGRIGLVCEVAQWIASALEHERVRVLALSPEIALDAVALPGEPNDPTDRFIVATARHHRARLVTRDAKIRQADWVSIVW